MATGTVKWFNPNKGYGFIQPPEGGRDVFVHISAVERAGLGTLSEGQRIEYELLTDRKGRTSAENLKVSWCLFLTSAPLRRGYFFSTAIRAMVNASAVLYMRPLYQSQEIQTGAVAEDIVTGSPAMLGQVNRPRSSRLVNRQAP